MNDTITNLERGLNDEQVKNARVKSLEECTVQKAVDQGMDYLAHLIKVYRENLRGEYKGEKDE